MASDETRPRTLSDLVQQTLNDDSDYAAGIKASMMATLKPDLAERVRRSVIEDSPTTTGRSN
jgi:hypothetical protein